MVVKISRNLLIISISLMFAFLNFDIVAFQDLAHSASPGSTFYVANNGNDQWTGTLPEPNSSGNDGPFTSLKRARNVIRQLRQSVGDASFTVLVRGGIYKLDETFVLDTEDSGTASHPLIFKAFPNEYPILSSNRRISNFEPHTNKIYKANLKGIINESDTVRQLFANGKRQILARYPNFNPENPIGGGFLYVLSPAQEESRRAFRYQDGSVRDWSNRQNTEVVIFPGNNWTNNILTVFTIDKMNQIIALSQDTSWGIKSGNRYYFQNIFEELDSPGEWYYDRQVKVLYYWPTNEISLETATIPVLKNIVQIRGKKLRNKYYGIPSHIRFEGFTLEGCDDSAIVINGGKGVVIAGNTIHNVGKHGIEIQEGSENAAIGNDIYDVGGDGIRMSGGDPQNVTPANNRADNNYIHHVGIYLKTSSGIDCRGVGNVISHNLIHSTPRVGIFFDGNEHLIEFNHIHHGNQETQDSGLIYCSQKDWTNRGTVIRFNYVHNSGGYGLNRTTGAWETPMDTFGIYLDDWTSGTMVYGNIVTNTFSGGIFIHGGRDNTIENNVIIEGGRPGQMIYSAWPPSHQVSQRRLPVMYAKVKEMGNTKYPLLSTIKDIQTGAMMSGNSFVRNIVYFTDPNAGLYSINNGIDLETTVSDYNIIYHSGLPLLIPFTKARAEQQWTVWQDKGLDKHSLIADPMFLDIKRGDFNLSPASPALRVGFKPIPFGEIGLYKDTLRASWPLPFKETKQH